MQPPSSCRLLHPLPITHLDVAEAESEIEKTQDAETHAENRRHSAARQQEEIEAVELIRISLPPDLLDPFARAAGKMSDTDTRTPFVATVKAGDRLVNIGTTVEGDDTRGFRVKRTQ